MRVIELSNKVYLTRHWFKWYFVRRGGQTWEPVGSPKHRKRVKTTSDILRPFTPPPLPIILDEAAADREVEKNTPKRT